MLLLRANTDILRVVTGSAADLEVHRSVLIADNASPPAIKAIPDLGPLASITTATTTTLVDTTGGTVGDNWNVKQLSAYNHHASTSTTALFETNDGTNSVVLWNGTLLAGEKVEFTEGGVWLHYDSNGGIYPSVGNKASQVDMEAGTADDRYVTPLSFNWHPGACKSWGKSVVSAGVPANTVSWNVTSITDSAVCRVTPVIATDFSSANYSIMAQAECNTTTYSATTTALIVIIRNATPTVTQFSIDLLEIDIGQTTDPASWFFACWGDQ